MAYNKTVWKDLPNETTPVNASNLNKIENELFALDQVANINIVTDQSVDLNNYTNEGKYFFKVIPANSPGYNGWMEVFSSDILTKQIWHRSSIINDSNEYQTFVRLRNRDNWSAWERYSMEQDSYYKAGDTFTQYVKTGAVTGSNYFRFQIPLAKPVKSGITPTVTIGNGNNCKLFQNGVLHIKSNIESISASVLANAIEVTCQLSSTPTGYSANVVTTTDIQCTVTFA